MADFTRDEWDDMQVGYDADGGKAWYVTCARCKKQLNIYVDGEAFLEEGDEWECEACNIRGDAFDYYHEHGVEVNFDNLFPLAGEAIAKYLLKG